MAGFLRVGNQLGFGSANMLKGKKGGTNCFWVAAAGNFTAAFSYKARRVKKHAF